MSFPTRWSIPSLAFHFTGESSAASEVQPWPPLAEIVERAGATLTMVICPRLSNPENLGAIARIADAFGMDAHPGRAFLPGPVFPASLARVDGIDTPRSALFRRAVR